MNKKRFFFSIILIIYLASIIGFLFTWKYQILMLWTWAILSLALFVFLFIVKKYKKP